MSLEIALQENTVAVKSLLAALLANVNASATLPDVIANAKAPDPEPKSETKPKVETKAKAEPKPPKTPVVKDAEALTYADIAPMIVAIAKEKGREVAIELMTEFGVKSGKDLKPEQYADFKAKADAIFNPVPETEDDLV